MPVAFTDLVFYGSANMQDTDSGTQGGAISTSKRVVFADISPSGNVQVVSSSASDTTQTVTSFGRKADGTLISEGKVKSADYVTGEASLANLSDVLKRMLDRGSIIKTAIIPGR